MAERKVLSKYYPPDFDPSKIKRVKKDPTKQQVVRLMAPFSMACKSCGEYIYKGRKFNARKEIVVNEDYYGIKIFRFYIKCTRCSAEITFKTDPKNTDYEMEHGATRNYQAWRDDDERERKEADPLAYLAEEERLKELEKLGRSDQTGAAASSSTEDPMASLEARQAESKREMEILDELQDIRTRNAKMDRVDAGGLIDALDRKRKAAATSAPSIEDLERMKAEEEDEELVRRYFSKAADAADGSQQRSIKRSLLEKEPEARQLLSDRAKALLGGGASSTVAPKRAKLSTTERDASEPGGEVQKDPTTIAATTPPPPPPRSTPTSTSTAPRPAHVAKSAAMAGMAAAAKKKQLKQQQQKKNVLGVVQKQVK